MTKKIFDNIVGVFVVEEDEIIDEFLYEGLDDCEGRDEVVSDFKEEYDDIRLGEKSEYDSFRFLLDDEKFYPVFYENNLNSAVSDVKDSVDEDEVISKVINLLDRFENVFSELSEQVRSWYSLYLPELVSEVDEDEELIELLDSKSRDELLDYLGVEEDSTPGSSFSLNEDSYISLIVGNLKDISSTKEEYEEYLDSLLSDYAPNLKFLCGVKIASRLIDQAGGLEDLAKFPSSTIQVLGAEDSLFKHLTEGSSSPKHGFISRHPIVSKSSNKGKAARKLADKISIAARLDYFDGDFKADEIRSNLEDELL